ncbi:hypothetical protein JG688_00005026 [Phytophthora aleatoria]|uniref:Uncharacterized protein n=1 Tax=Phytophthora aleatoria TaxID=2496075 RepID=A0A8J5JDC3_9STRA|nr:hypothetical protein JG688_00005026 [Phytophthora aleatoria]
MDSQEERRLLNKPNSLFPGCPRTTTLTNVAVQGPLQSEAPQSGRDVHHSPPR